MTHDSKEYAKKKWSERYKSSLKQLKPIRSTSKEPGHVMPGPGRGCLSLYSLSWLTSLMWKACRDKLRPDDIWTLRSEDSSRTNYVRLERLWRQEVELKGKQAASLTMTILRAFRTRIIMTTLLLLVSNSLALLGPSILLRQMIVYLNDSAAPASQAVVLLVLMVVLRFFSIYFMAGAFGVTSVFTGARACGALQIMVYHKLLRLSAASDQILGKVVNICINDMERLSEALRIAAFVISALCMTAYGFVVNLVYVGPWSILGFSVIVSSFFVLGSIGGMISVRRLAVVTVTDRRVSFMSEILAAIRLIKMYAWEQSFKNKIEKIRTEEIDITRKATFLTSISNVLTPIIPILATATSVVGYIASGNELRAAEAFTMFSVFNALQMAVGTLPYGIKMITETHVALRRIQRLLLMKDIEIVLEHCDSGGAIEMVNATLAWEKPVARKGKSEKKREERSARPSKSVPRIISSPKLPSSPQAPLLSRLRALSERRRRPADSEASLDAETATQAELVLSGLSLAVPAGRLLGVAGAVGSGKSSLLFGMTGQLRVLCGSVRRAGSMALVPQRAWIFSGTVRENVLFGRPLLPELYQRTLDACALRPDLEMMEHGDLSEIGERGVNLSGGQKQRVNLARAVYADADIYLLDDPLSAVDSKVGQHIFQHCVRGVLRDKTVVLVSHGVQYLSQCDEVVFMKEGRVAEHGSHQELMELQGGYHQLVSCDAASQRQSRPADIAQDTAANEEMGTPGGQFITDESYGSTMGIFKNFALFFKYCGVFGMLLIMVLMLSLACCRTGSGLYLQYWIEAGDGRKEERLRNMTRYNVTYEPSELAGAVNDHPDVDLYTAGYAATVLGLFVFGLLKAWNYARCVMKGATRVHDRMVSSLVHCKMSFFDSTPSGRILNRFSRDMDCVDNRIPDFYEFLSQRFTIVVVQLMVPMTAYPYYAIVVATTFVLYGVLWRCLVTGIRNTKRLENVLRSPVLQHLGSTVSGLSVIRTYDKQRMMVDRFAQLLDRHTSSLLTFRLANSWFCLRADELGLLLLGTISSVLLLGRTGSPAEAGLILSLVYDTIGIMPFLVMLCSELAALMSAVERCTEYCEGLEYEPPAEVANSGLSADWPERGAVQLQGVSLRYRSDLPRVLHDLSVSIPARQKVGIVGRTGAGKSTLISTLLRMMDLETGSVFIDGVDISTIGLRDLRSRLSVIPQEAVLFTGTIRQNLDPFEEHADARVWYVLERAGLKAKVSRLPLQLLTPVTSDGDNFSVGERQLVCLARALLRRSRVLLLDEATASVDVQTDYLIQRTIREDFDDSTVITIAHRLNTVLGYDSIIVMEAGRIIEMGPPRHLAANPSSQFRQMLDQAGISSLIGSEVGSRPPLAEQEVVSDDTQTPPPVHVYLEASDVTAGCDVTAGVGSVSRDEAAAPQTAGAVRTAEDRGSSVEITRL